MNVELKKEITTLKVLEQQSFPNKEIFTWYQNLKLTEEIIKPYIFFKPNKHTRNLIADSDNFELVLICWPPQKSVAIHGHEGQKCWMKVLQGQLRFVSYKEVTRSPKIKLQKVSDHIGGVGFVDGPAHIHAVHNCFEQPAISLHLYARPIRECDIYNVKKHCIERKKMGYNTKYGQPTN